MRQFWLCSSTLTPTSCNIEDVERSCWALSILIGNVLTSACGNELAPRCVEGASVACACPSGGSGAQTCDSAGKFLPCSCASVPANTISSDAGSTSGSNASTKCSIDGLHCENFKTNGLSEWKLHELVFQARNAKRFEEAICLAQLSTRSADKVLAGASYFEQSHAWEGLGCRDMAVGAIEQSIQVRPSDKNGWKETCARCEVMRADCAPCTNLTADRVPCPSMDRLAAIVGESMLKQAPPGDTWRNAKSEMCIPIGLPHPGWYGIGWVERESPDREFWFHFAIDAKTSRVVAISGPAQRKYNYVCETKFEKVMDTAGKPSKVMMTVDCMDKMGNASPSKIEATVVGSKIELLAN